MDMKHTVIIDDETLKGAELMDIIKQFPRDVVEFVEDDEKTISAEEFFATLRSEVDKKFAEKEKIR